MTFHSLLVLVIALAGLQGCKSEDSGKSGESEASGVEVPSGAAKDPVASPSPSEEAKPRGARQPPPPPAENTGEVTYRGKTAMLTGKAFAICETVNPATKGDFNIVATLEDGTKLKLLGNIEDHSADHQGLILGDMPSEEKASELKLELEGRTLSGSAQTAAGPISFRFDC